MVNEILTESGFIENETYKETRFRKAPTEVTYAIYTDSQSHRGADGLNLLTEHEITIEVYEYYPDHEAEDRIEKALNARSIEWIKQPQYWINEEQVYQVIYEFSYIEKKGV